MLIHPLVTCFFSSYLLHQILSIILIDCLDAVLQSSFFLIVISFILIPHSGLLINICFFFIFSLFFLSHLLIQEFSHFCLIVFDSLKSSFFHQSLVHFSFIFVSCEHFFFELLSLTHLTKNIICHFVHKLLSSSLSGFHFLLSIIFLLIEHFGVVVLSF